MAKDDVEYTIQTRSETAQYYYGRFQEYLLANPDEIETLTFGAYLGHVVLGSLKSLLEGKVPEIYVPEKVKSDPIEPCSRDGKVSGLGI